MAWLILLVVPLMNVFVAGQQYDPGEPVIRVPTLILPHDFFPSKPWAFVNAADQSDPFLCVNPVTQDNPLNATEVAFEWIFSKVTMCAEQTTLEAAFPTMEIDPKSVYTSASSPGRKVVLREFVLSSVLTPAKEPFLFPDDDVVLTVLCGGVYKCSPNFFGYYSREPDCRRPVTTIEQFQGTGATYYNLTEMYLTLDLRRLYGFYYVCFARTKFPNLDFVHHASGIYNYSGLNAAMDGMQGTSMMPEEAYNATRDIPVERLQMSSDFWDPDGQIFATGSVYERLFVTRWTVNPDLVFWNGAHTSQFIFPGHATLDHKEIWHSVPDFVNSGIRVFVFPAHSWDYNFRGPRPILLNQAETGGNFVHDDATFMVLRSNSPEAVEFYLANATVSEQNFEELSPYAQTSYCDTPSEVIESTRTNFTSVPSLNTESSVLYEGSQEYKLFAYMDTKDLSPRRTYTLCSETFGSARLLRTWTTDLFARPSHLTPYPTTSLVTNLFSMKPGNAFKTDRIFLGDENCKMEEFYLNAVGSFSQPVSLDFGPHPPAKAQVLLTKFVNYDIVDNPYQTLKFYCPNARASTCLEGVTVYLFSIN